MNNCNIKIAFCATSLFCFSLPDKLTSLALQPVITPELVQGRAHLRCSYSPSSPEPPVQYRVLWSRLSSSGKREQIHQETTPQPFSHVEMDGTKLRLGDTVTSPRLQHHGSHTQRGSNLSGNRCCVFISAAPHSLCSGLLPRKRPETVPRQDCLITLTRFGTLTFLWNAVNSWKVFYHILNWIFAVTLHLECCEVCISGGYMCLSQFLLSTFCILRQWDFCSRLSCMHSVIFISMDQRHNNIFSQKKKKIGTF